MKAIPPFSSDGFIVDFFEQLYSTTGAYHLSDVSHFFRLPIFHSSQMPSYGANQYHVACCQCWDPLVLWLLVTNI